MIVGPVQFDTPAWLLLAPALWALAWWIARRSLSGLNPLTRRVALGVRFLVIALICAALAEPRWRTESDDVAAIVIADASRSMPPANSAFLRASGASSPCSVFSRYAMPPLPDWLLTRITAS